LLAHLLTSLLSLEVEVVVVTFRLVLLVGVVEQAAIEQVLELLAVAHLPNQN
jgi:hypothetical protein